MKKLYIWWEWVDSWKYLDVDFPYNWEKIDTISLARDEDIDSSIEKALESFKQTSKMEPFQRADILRFIVKELEIQKEDFSKLLMLENWKTINEARLEIERTIVTFRIAIWEAERIYGESYDLWVSPLSAWRFGIVKKFPAWVVAWITPFNFPMNLSAHKIAPAIATGCPIIIKPASATPLTMLKLAEIIEKSDLSKWAFSVVPCDRHTWQKLVEDDRISVLSFTWSPFVWWKMKAEAWRKKTVLELWWNAWLIVDKDVENWDFVISRSVMWAYYQAGQTCISVQRIFVHSSIYDEFKAKFIKAIEEFKPWDPRLEETKMGSIIDQKNRDRLWEWINEAIEKWAKLLTWNKWEWTILEATLLENVPKNCELWVEEAFWAVASIEKFDNFDEVIEKVNDSKFGLQVWVFSKNIDNIMNCFNNIEVWWVIQNDVPSFRADMMPYWWVKDSGLWREGIKYAMEDMLEEKILVLKSE